MSSPITIAVNQLDDGRYRAEVVGCSRGAIEAESLKELFDRLEEPVSEVLGMSDEDREDLAAARAGLEEVAKEGTIPWETVKNELGL